MKRWRSMVAFCFITLVVIAGGVAQAQEYAMMSVTQGHIVWSPQVSNGGVSLSVTGPNDVYVNRTYSAGGSPSLELVDDTGNHLPDGQYSYELRFAPVTGTMTRLKGQPDAALQVTEPMVQSGSFRILSGQFLVPSAGGELAGAQPHTGIVTPMDQVVADDQIVQGSLCVGLDCVTNESFGFDTIRLKENNTRIKFDDTSTSAGFPANDWQITANDSNSGGASYLAFDDVTGSKTPFKVLAGAPTNSLYVSSNGKVGIRTATPVLDLSFNTSDTPAIRLEQNNSGGFTAQTWDIAGNEANFFVRDVTGGSRLPFRIRPGAPTSSIDISANGNVGVGTSAPDATLKVAGTIYPAEKVTRTVDFTGGGRGVAALELKSTADMADGFGPSFEFWISDNTYTASSGVVTMEGVRDGGDTSGKWILRTANAGALGARLVVNKSGNVGIGTTAPTHLIHLSGGAYSDGATWTDASSREYKENIQTLSAEKAMEAFKQLSPVVYYYKTDAEQKHVGFIAEDVPDLVAMKGRKGLNAMDIVAVLTKVVQGQNKTIDNQQKAIDDLKSELASLRSMVSRISTGNMLSAAYPE